MRFVVVDLDHKLAATIIATRRATEAGKSHDTGNLKGYEVASIPDA
jgi:hypothetical protein